MKNGKKRKKQFLNKIQKEIGLFLIQKEGNGPDGEQKKKRKQAGKAARKAEADVQRQLEIEEDEECELIDRFGSGRPYVCTAETKADLEANMYDRRKRVIFSQKMLKAMSLERTFWQNWRWKAGS